MRLGSCSGADIVAERVRLMIAAIPDDMPVNLFTPHTLDTPNAAARQAAKAIVLDYQLETAAANATVATERDLLGSKIEREPTATKSWLLFLLIMSFIVAAFFIVCLFAWLIRHGRGL